MNIKSSFLLTCLLASSNNIACLNQEALFKNFILSVIYKWYQPAKDLHQNEKTRQSAHDFLYALETRAMIAQENNNLELLAVIQQKIKTFKEEYDESMGNVSDYIAWTALGLEMTLCSMKLAGIFGLAISSQLDEKHGFYLSLFLLAASLTRFNSDVISPLLSQMYEQSLIDAKDMAKIIEEQ